MTQADIGLVGLAVMGENLILNMESKGFAVACYNRTVSKVDDFVNGRAKGKKIIGCRSIGELTANLKKPRKDTRQWRPLLIRHEQKPGRRWEEKGPQRIRARRI